MISGGEERGSQRPFHFKKQTPSTPPGCGTVTHVRDICIPDKDEVQPVCGNCTLVDRKLLCAKQIRAKWGVLGPDNTHGNRLHQHLPMPHLLPLLYSWLLPLPLPRTNTTRHQCNAIECYSRHQLTKNHGQGINCWYKELNKGLQFGAPHDNEWRVYFAVFVPYILFVMHTTNSLLCCMFLSTGLWTFGR